MKNNYFIQIWDQRIFPLDSDYDQIALLRPSEFNNIFEKTMGQMANNNVEGLIMLSYHGRTIYKKYVANTAFPEDGCVILSYRSLAELGIDPKDIINTPDTVSIEPASAFAYLWNNSYSYLRKPFRWAVCGLLLTIFFGLISIAFAIFQLICCC